MPTLTRAVDAWVRHTRQASGAPLATDPAARVSARFFADAAASLPLTDEVLAIPTDAGAAWHAGRIVFRFDADATAGLEAPESWLQVAITDPGAMAATTTIIRCAVLDLDDTPGTALFPDPAAAIDALRLRLSRVAALMPLADSLDDAEIWVLLRAAEADAERALRVFFGDVEVLPETATQADRDALDLAGTRWIDETGYDLESEFFAGDRWGTLETRHRPISAVHSIHFVYPRPIAGVFDVPADWVRLDKKYGHIRLLPGSQASMAPLSIGIMQVMGGGRDIPQMIQVRYTAGLTQPARTYPELPDLVLRMALVRLLSGLLPPASTSISADGLSESQALDVSKYQADIDALLERLRQAIHGVQLVVF